MIYVALDPGGTTGAARLNGVTGQVKTCELEHELAVWNFLDTYKPDVLIYEDFLWQNRSKVDFRPIEVIGVIKLYSKLGLCKLTKQSPSHGKGFWDNDKLKRVGLYVKGSEHERDATRHLLHYISFREKDSTYLEMLKD